MTESLTAHDRDGGSLLHRMGGPAAVRELVQRFHDLAAQDPDLRRHFAGVDLRMLKLHQVALLTGVLDGGGARATAVERAGRRVTELPERQYLKISELLATALAGADERMLAAAARTLADTRPQVVYVAPWLVEPAR